jgi:hypothetical protein
MISMVASMRNRPAASLLVSEDHARAVLDHLRPGEWFAALPYGQWTCADGRRVLFNRRYRPILERLPDGQVRAMNYQWVTFIRQTWFYNEQTEPRERWRNANGALARWGLPPLPKRPWRRLGEYPPHHGNPWLSILGGALA